MLATRIETALGRAARPMRFFIVGGTATAINICILYGLTEFAGVWYIASEILAFLVALTVNFILQRQWTFKSRSGNARKQAVLFVGVNLWNLLLNALLLYSLVEFFGYWYILAQVAISILIAVQSFFLYRFIFTDARQ